MESIPESEKQKPKYNKEMAMWVYSKYVRNRTSVGYGLDTYFDQLRLFGKGKQSEERYKPYNKGVLDRSYGNVVSTDVDNGWSTDKEYRREGWGNINEEVISPLPNIKSTIKGQFVDVDYDIKAQNIDIDAGAEEETYAMHKLWINSPKQLGLPLQALKQAAGLPQSQQDYTPESFSELEEIQKEGGFKLPYINQHEKLLQHTENISHWDRSLKEKFIDDLTDLGIAFSHAYYDDETCKVKWRYTDPKNVIMPYSRYEDFRDSDYAGIFDYPSISDIRQKQDYIVNSRGEKISEDDLASIAHQYSSYYDNPSEAEWDNYNRYLNDGRYRYDDHKTCTVKVWWIDVDNEKKIEYTNKYGKKRYYKNDGKVKKLGKREVFKNVRTRKLYYCTWIVGTDFVYDFGLMPNQPRPEKTRPKLPIVGYKLNEESLVQRLIPVCDVYQIAWLNFQNALANAVASGYAVNLTMLATMSDGAKKYDPLEALNLFRKKGLMFYKSTVNGVGVGGTPVPIQKIEGSMGDEMIKQLGLMDQMVRQIEVLTGLSPVALGQTPSAETPVGTTQLSLQATTNALRTLVDGVRIIKEELATVTSPMIQLSIKNSPKARKQYSKVIGKKNVDILKIAKEQHTEYGITLVAKPTQQEKLNLLEIAKAAFQAKRSGAAGINEGQLFYIEDQLNNGTSIKELSYKMQSWIQQDEQRLQAERDRAITLQGQQNQQLAATQGEQDRQTLAASLQVEQQKGQIKVATENAIRTHDKNMNIEEIKAKARADAGKEITVQNQAVEATQPQSDTLP
jgi:hypothetical protein